MNTRYIDEYLKNLRKHENFLAQKLAEKDEEKSHFLRKELLALRWMISYTEDTKEAAAEHQLKWFQEGK